MPKYFPIGISGVAASGKTTMAQLLSQRLHQEGRTTVFCSIAAKLKDDLAPFVREHFGLDIYRLSDGEKEMIRPLMVGYASAKRAQNPNYWVEAVRPTMEGLLRWPQLVLCDDVRFLTDCELIHSLGGVVIHLTRRVPYNALTDPGYFVGINPPPIVEKIAANFEEHENDPLVKAQADLQITWGEGYNNETVVDEVVSWLSRE